MFALYACGKSGAPVFTYDPSVMSTANTPEEVRANLPDAATLAAASTCGPAGGVATTAQAKAWYQACDLAGLAPMNGFVFATGDRELAARVYVWLRSSRPNDAARVAGLLLGPSALPTAFSGTVPELPGAASAPVPVPVVVPNNLNGPGAWGPFPYWQVPGFVGAPALVIDAAAPISALRYALASSGPPGTTVPLVVAGDGLTTVAISSPGPTETPRVRYTGGALAIPEGSAVRIEVADDVTVGAWVSSLGPALGKRIELAIDHAPCGEAPMAGMRCVPGEGKVPTYWIDEAGTVDSAACRAAGACTSPGYTWSSARELCSYLGKRLPTRWEFERAGLALTSPAWTATWAGPGEPPLGLCDDHPTCAKSTRKLLSDGTEKAPTTPNKAPVVCATERWRTAWPPLQVTDPKPEPPPLVAEPDRAAIAASVQGDSLTDKGICGEDVRKNWRESLQKGGRSSTTCRDPFSYVTSNEPLRYLFGRMVRNTGGGYVGVGSDQSYDFITAARSSWAWVFDYDPNVVRLHQVNVPLLKAAATRQEFVALWEPAARDRAHDLIEAAYPPEDAAKLVAFYNGYRPRLQAHYAKLLRPMAEDTTFGWLATDPNYAHLRTLAEQGRLIPTPLDMLATKGMRSVGEKARQMGVTIRVYYTSNAPTAWGGEATPDYKKNVLALPFDDESVVIATTNSGGFKQSGHWHYNVMNGLLFQRRMASPSYLDNKAPMWDRIPGDNGNLTVVGLRSR
jgi:hypothetical protein